MLTHFLAWLIPALPKRNLWSLFLRELQRRSLDLEQWLRGLEVFPPETEEVASSQGCFGGPTRWGSCLSRGLNSRCHRLFIRRPGGRKSLLSWAWRFPPWNTRWLSLSIWRGLSGKLSLLLTWLCRPLAVTSPLPASPLLFAVHTGSFCAWVGVCVYSTWRERTTFWIDFLSYFQLTSLSFFYEKGRGVLVLLICAQQELPFPIQLGKLAIHYREWHRVWVEVCLLFNSYGLQ